MPTTTRRAIRRAAPAADRQLPYPELEPTESKLFWLSAYLRDLAEFVVLRDHLQHLYGLKKTNSLLVRAVGNASWAKQGELTKSARHLVTDGLLLFAHPDTTVLDKQVVA